MPQHRLHIQADKSTAEHYYALLDTALEDDGYPVAITEIDEAKAIYETSIYIDSSESESLKQRMATIIHVAPSTIKTEILPDIDWVSHSLAGLKPVRAGRFFVHGSHDRDKVQPNDLAIEIDAGQAFGTGHHGTTAGCLEMIEDVLKVEHPKNALDLGTGSGVLAIGIALIEPIEIVASDIDPIAIQVTDENIALNKVADHITTVVATGFDHPDLAARAPFDLVVANILANPLIELAPEMAKALAPNGSMILSGILDEQEAKVVEAYIQAGLQHIRTTHKEGWVTIHLKH